ncbi:MULTISPECIES: hypothetical protein [Kytococcus]|nr:MULTISPECIES: hypothetical protein [Kytococcus]
MKNTLLALGIAGVAALLVTRTLDKNAKTSELWAAATDELPAQV